MHMHDYVQREFEEWTSMNVVVYHDSSDGRGLIRQHEFWFDNEPQLKAAGITKFNVLITSYNLVRQDFEEFRNIHWRYGSLSHRQHTYILIAAHAYMLTVPCGVCMFVFAYCQSRGSG